MGLLTQACLQTIRGVVWPNSDEFGYHRLQAGSYLRYRVCPESALKNPRTCPRGFLRIKIVDLHECGAGRVRHIGNDDGGV